ncbi:MAG: DNA polymerase III subunit gamma/tau [Candidatus Levybacteria bacterium]|nr:DNA polymerase III subunit gamma/tau [Candidatus Levybacteria bacterium]
MVYYRKYRPQTINELDSKAVRQTLLDVLSGKEIPHAFLFTGPKGLGKTSTARIVAKVVNCEKKKNDIEPCNKCDQCRSISNGTNMDILEIDGASNRGIDEIRDLREKVRLSALRAKKKVYIIDEVHMLTTEAFNALLKTLEEPPSHVMFILCTTEPHKVPATIASRCFHIAFRKAEPLELVRSFKRIAKKEKLNIDMEALELIASLSDGSFRDGVKILEEVVGFAGRKKITKKLIEERYQISNLEHQVSQMIKFLEERNTASALKLISELTKQGLDMKYLLEQIIEKLHSLLLARAGVTKEAKILDSNLQIGEIKGLVELLVKAHQELKYAILPQLPLEMVIIEWGGKKERTDNLSHIANDAQNTVSKIQSKTPSLSERQQQNLTENSKVNQSAFSSFASEQLVGSSKREGKSDFWTKFIEKVRPYNHSVAGVLRGCSLKDYSGDKLVIETKFKFHKERLDERKVRDILEKATEDITGKKVQVSVILKN